MKKQNGSRVKSIELKQTCNAPRRKLTKRLLHFHVLRRVVMISLQIFRKTWVNLTRWRMAWNMPTILVKILWTSHKIALLQSLIQCPPLPPFQCWLNQTPFDHPNIELGGGGDEKVLNVCFHIDILGNMTKTHKFASIPIYFN